MPAQSCLLPLNGHSSLDLVPFISKYHPDTIHYILKNSPLTMRLCDYHLHYTSDSNDLFSLDFQLATSLWFILKDISQTIQLTTNPLPNPFSNLPGMLDPKLINQIGMPFPAILSIENYTQNLLIVMSTWAKLYCLFGIAQKARLDGAQWIQTAKERWIEAEDSLNWDWSESGNGPAYSGNFPKPVNCSYTESGDDSDESDYSKALVFHLTLSTYIQEHPNFDPFILSSDDESF
jgi:hypothetical protein